MEAFADVVLSMFELMLSELPRSEDRKWLMVQEQADLLRHLDGFS
jgi:hypothetical protein